MPSCFVMQPFDGSEFDRRFDEIYKPAIEEAGFEPYRVDRDPSASVPIANIEKGILGSVACFADVTIDNPNVWFELGYAICAKKPLCLICGPERQRFPFDVQHRKIIRYNKSSPSDFATLRNEIVERLKAIQDADNTIEEIVKEQNNISTGRFDILDFSALCIIFENQDSDDDKVSAWAIINDMERAGYTKLATRIALKRLVDINMISVELIPEAMNEGAYSGYRVTNSGAKYILSNQDKIEIRRKSTPRPTLGRQVIDDDIPF